MTKIILTGATGISGSEILKQALASSYISQVTVLTRRPTNPPTHPKLSTILIPNAEGWDHLSSAVLEQVKGADACIWTLGVAQGDVSREEYITITRDWTIHAAESFASMGNKTQPFKFIYLSGDFVDQAEKASSTYANIKGRTEKDLTALGSESFKTVCLRAGGIVPSEEHVKVMTVKRRIVLQYSAPMLGFLHSRLAVQSTDLAGAALRLAIGRGWERRTAQGWISNNDLKVIASGRDEL